MLRIQREEIEYTVLNDSIPTYQQECGSGSPLSQWLNYLAGNTSALDLYRNRENQRKTDRHLFTTWQVIADKCRAFHTTGVRRLVRTDRRLKQDTRMFNYQTHSIETGKPF